MSKRQANFSLFNIKRAVFVCVVLFCVAGAFGANYTWNWTSGNTNWDRPQNWNPNGTPGTSDTAIFNADATITIPTVLEVGQITADANVILTTGTTLTIGIIDGTGSVTATATDVTVPNDAASAFSASGGVSFKSLNAQGTIALSTNITTTGAQTYGGDVTLGGDMTLNAGGSAIAFGGNVTGSTHNLSLTAGTLEINNTATQEINVNNLLSFDGVFTKSTAAQTTFTNGFSQTGSGAVSLQGTITTSGDLSFEGATILNENTVINSNGSNVSFGSTIKNGGGTTNYYKLDINAGVGTIIHGGGIGASDYAANPEERLGAISLTGNQINLYTYVRVNGLQTYEGPVSISGGAYKLNSYGYGISFTSTFTGNTNSLTTEGSTMTFGGNVSGLTTMTIGSPLTIADGVNISTTGPGAQTYSGAVTLSGSTTLDAGATNNITFSSTVNGGSLAIDAANTVTFNGNVTSAVTFNGTTTLTTGASRTLSGVTVGATTGNLTLGSAVSAGAVTLNTDSSLIATDVNTLAATTVSATGASTISGSITTTGAGGQNYAGAVTIGGTGVTTLDADASNISFGNGINLNQNLTLNTTGDISVTGAVSGAQDLTVTAANQVSFAGDVTAGALAITATTGTTFTDSAIDVTTFSVTSGTTSFSGISSITAATSANLQNVTVASGTLTLGSNVFATAVTLSDGSALTTGANTLTSPTTLSGSATVSGNITGDVVIPANVVQTLTLDGNLTITGNLNTHTAGSEIVTLAIDAHTLDISGFFNATPTGGTEEATIVVTGTGNLSMGSFDTTQTGTHTLTAPDVSSITVSTEFWANVDTGTALLSITLDAQKSTINLNSEVYLGGNTNATLTIKGETINFNNTVSTYSDTKENGALVVEATTVTFVNTVGADDRVFDTLTVTAPTININGGSVITTGAQTYKGKVQTTAATLILNASADADTDIITFAGDVTATALTLTASQVTFDGTTIADRTITVTSGLNNYTGDFLINTAAGQETTFTNGFSQISSGGTIGDLSLQGTVVASANGLSFSGATTLAGDTELTATNANITFAGEVTGAENLSLSATGATGKVTFSNNVGTPDALTGITVSNTAEIIFNKNLSVSTTFSIPDTAHLQFLSPTNNQSISLPSSSIALDVAGKLTIQAPPTASANSTTFSKGITQTGDDGTVTLSGNITATDGGLNFAGNITSDGATKLTATGTDGQVSFGGNMDFTSNNLSFDTLHLIFNSTDAQEIKTNAVLTFEGQVSILAGATTTFSNGFEQTVTDASTEVVKLSGTITSSANGFSFNGDTTLTDNTTITATDQNVTFGSTIKNGMSSGNASLEINAGTGTITHKDGIGQKTIPTPAEPDSVRPSKVTLRASNIVFKGGYVRATGDHSYTGAVSLSPTTNPAGSDNGAGVRFNSSGGNIVFNGTIDGKDPAGTDSDFKSTFALQTFSGKSITFNGAVTNIAYFQVYGNSNLNDGIITSSQYQTYSGAVTLGVDNTLTSTNSYISFSSTVRGEKTLNLDAGDSITFNNNVGVSGAELTKVDIQDATIVNINRNFYADALTFTDTTSHISFNPTATQTITVPNTADNGFTTVGGNVTINTFYTPSSPAGSPETELTTTFTNGFTQKTGGGTVSLAGTVIAGANGLSFSGATILTRDTTLNAGAQTITLTGTINSEGSETNSLTLGDSAEVTTVNLNSAIGATQELSNLSINADAINISSATITTTGNQDYGTTGAGDGNVVLNADTTTLGAGAGSISFKGTVNADGTPTDTEILTITDAGTVIFGGIVGTTPLTALSVTATNIEIDGNITTNGTLTAPLTDGQYYNGAVTLGNDITFSSNNKPIEFVGAVNGANSLTIEAGSSTVSFDGGLGTDTAAVPTGLTANAATINIGAAGVTTNGNQDYNGNVIGSPTGGPTNNIIANAGTIAFSKDVFIPSPLAISGSEFIFDGTSDQAFTANNEVTFPGIIRKEGTTTLSVTNGFQQSGDVANKLNGTIITPNGRIAFGGSVNLVGSTSLDAGTRDVILGRAVNATTLGTESLTVTNAGHLWFKDPVGNSVPLSTLNVTATKITLDAYLSPDPGSITTTAGQTYNGPVTLGTEGTDLILSSTGDGDILFSSTIDGEKTLSIDAEDNDVSFAGAVGTTTELSTLSINATTINVNGGSVTTTGNQTYGTSGASAGNVLLAKDTTFTAENTATIAFKGDLTGNADPNTKSLTIGSVATATFGGVVGNVSTVAVTAGTINVNGGSVTSSNWQTYNGNVTLNQATTLNASSDTITFSGDVTGATHALTLTAGTLVLDNASDQTINVSNTPLELAGNFTKNTTEQTTFTKGFSQTGSGAVSLQGAIIASANGLSFEGATTLTEDTSLTATSNIINFGSTVSSTGGNHPLTIPTATDVTFTGAVGTLGDITVTNSSSVAFSNTLTTNTTDGSINLTATNGVTVEGSVTGQDITIKATNIALNAGSITTTGAQSYTGATTFDKDSTLKTSGGNVGFTGAVNGNKKLSIDTTATQGYVRFTSTLQATDFAFNTLAVELNGNVTVTSLAATAGDVYITNASTFTATSGTAKFPQSLFIVAGSGRDVSFTASPALIVQNSFVLFTGNITLGNSLTTNTGDVVLFGSAYDDDYRGLPANITGLFAYSPKNPTPARTAAQPSLIDLPTVTPWTGTAIPQETSNPETFSGTLTDLAGKTITVGKNFYANGINLSGSTTWNLDIPDNSNAFSAFAEVYNLEIEKASVANRTGSFAWLSAAETVTDGTGNANVAFARPLLRDNDITLLKNEDFSGTYTVTDDMVRVEFRYVDGTEAKIENSYNEISKAVASASIKFNTGGTYSNGFSFGGTFSNPEGTETTDGKGDLSVFYIRISQDIDDITKANQRWNTDATGTQTSKNNTNLSTDMGRGVTPTHRNTMPNIHIPIALSFVYETLRDQYKNRIATTYYDATADRCAPVLIAAYTGQELHGNSTTDPSSLLPYDAHNFVELIYSEEIEITGVNKSATNVRATANFGHAPTSANGITITGIANITGGSLSTGTSDGNEYVNALYRNYSIDGVSAPIEHTNRVRISIAGFVDDLNPHSYDINEDGILENHHNWVGHIIDAVAPSGTITPLAGVTDATTNPTGVDTVIGRSFSNTGNNLYTGWDTSPPVLAKFSAGIDAWADGSIEKEILAYSDTLFMKNIEIHFFDNTPSYDENERYKWISTGTDRRYNLDGWFDNGTLIQGSFIDTYGGSRFNDARSAIAGEGGIRSSSLVVGYDSLKIALTDGGMPQFDGFSQRVKSSFLLGEANSYPSSVTTRPGGIDTPYVSMNIAASDYDKFPLYSNLNVTYDGTQPITDLAGNKMKNIEAGEASSIYFPYITLTIAPIGSKEMFVLFSTQMETSASVLSEIPKNLSLDPAVVGSLSIDTSIPAKVVADTDLGTGYIITLNEEVSYENIVATAPAPLGGETVAKPLSITGTGIFRKDSSVFAVTSGFPLSIFATNIFTPLYAYDEINFGQNTFGDGLSVARIFDGSGVTGNTVLANTDITLEFASIPEGETSSITEDVAINMSVNPSNGSVSVDYNTLTGLNSRVWLPSVVGAISGTANTNTKRIDGLDPSAGEVAIPVASDYGWGAGNQLQFIFELPNKTIDHDNNIITPPIPLYALHLKDKTDPLSIDLWSLDIEDIVQQRGNVTIVNNVINVNVAEKARLEVVMPQDGTLSIHVLTLDGNIVKTLHRGRETQGTHYYEWDGKNGAGNSVARGMYFVRVVGPGIDETRKVMAVKE